MKRDTILIEADELLTKLEQPNVRIYDATILFFAGESDLSAYEQYLQAHIPGAAFFDHQDFSDSGSAYMYTILPEADLAAQIGQVGIGEDAEVIFYTSGVLPCATRAWWLLRYAGHNNVRVLNGGLAAWQEAGGEIEQGARQYSPANFTARLRADMFVNKEEVQAALADDRVGTVYTLPPDMYKAGQIVGSTSLSCMELMQGMDCLLSDDVLAARLAEEARYERIITYCGGGIAATVNAMAHLIAGNENVAVYDGSLTEWVGEGLPTTKG